MENKKIFSGYKMTYKFNASHSFNNDESKKHAHTFWVNIYISKDVDFFVEFREYELVIKEYFKKYQGKYLNNLEEFKKFTPTIENMCKVFYDEVFKIFESIVEFDLIKLEVGDGPTKSVSIGNKIIAGGANVFISKKDFDKYKRSIFLEVEN